MNYTKPEVAVLGKAGRVIESTAPSKNTTVHAGGNGVRGIFPRTTSTSKVPKPGARLSAIGA